MFRGWKPIVGLDERGRRQPLSQILDAELVAKPCQVMISSEVLAMVKDQCVITQMSSASFRLDSLHSEEVSNTRNVPGLQGCTNDLHSFKHIAD